MCDEERKKLVNKIIDEFLEKINSTKNVDDEPSLIMEMFNSIAIKNGIKISTLLLIFFLNSIGNDNYFTIIDTISKEKFFIRVTFYENEETPTELFEI